VSLPSVLELLVQFQTDLYCNTGVESPVPKITLANPVWERLIKDAIRYVSHGPTEYGTVTLSLPGGEIQVVRAR
jgi:hypothetical protein